MKRVIQVDERPSLIESLPLSLQHLFAMFGSTVLVPVLLHADVATVLLMNGIGTLLYLFICRGKIPAYLGSSFAFLSPVFVVLDSHSYSDALGGFIIVGIIFCLVGLLVNRVGTGWIDVVFPPAAMGAIVAVIGLELVPTAAKMAGIIAPDPTDACKDFFAKVTDKAVAIPPECVPYQHFSPDMKIIAISLGTLLFTIIANVMFRGFMKIIPILSGIVFGYLLAWALGELSLSTVTKADFFQIPHFTGPTWNLDSIVIIVPAALVVIAEHIGHLVVTSNIVERDLSKDPGLDRSLLGNGISTIISGFVGSTPNTTYGENIGVLALTKVYSTWIIGGAAVIAVVLSFFGKLAALISSIPTPVMGGISLLLFGVIASSGIRMLVESKVDYNKPTNLILTTVVLVIGLSGTTLEIGNFSMKGMALATVVAIVLSLFFKLIEVLKLSNED